jgi:dihydroorotate dehydrogenase (fumarate)
MVRKAYTSVGQARGLLAVPADADQTAYERAGYVRALQAANSAHSPW